MGILGFKADSAAEMNNVESPDPTTVAALKLAVSPDNWPRGVAVKLTVPVNPFTAWTVMVLLAWPPGVTLSVAGAEERVKFGPVLAGARALSRFCPLGEPKPVTRS